MPASVPGFVTLETARQAAAFLFATSGALLLGALGFEHLAGLAPCEMCYWQRWAHLAVLAIAAAAFVSRSRALIGLAILAMLAAAALGLYHAGVEQGWWPGLTGCTAAVAPGMTADDMLATILAAPLVRCDAIAWSFLGLSMAGWNALISALAALAALMIWRRG